MNQDSPARIAPVLLRLARWLGVAAAIAGIVIVPVVVLTLPSGTTGNVPHPLAPPATDSPRATLDSFRSAVGEAEQILRETYDVHIRESGFFESPETRAKVAAARAHLSRAIRCFDTSEIPPSVRTRTALEAA